MPTAPLAPYPAELGAFEVWANLARIGVVATENDVFDPKVSQTAEKIAFTLYRLQYALWADVNMN